MKKSDLKKSIARVESSIKKMKAVDGKKKKELIKVLNTLESEVEKLSKTHTDHARSIAGFTEIATHESTRREKARDLQELSLDGLASSVEGFEVSHPKLVDTVNRVCMLLSGIGI